MRKTILTALTLSILHLTGFSQKPWMGFQAGVGFSNMVLKGNNESSASQLLPGFTTGVLMDWALSKKISIQPGINFMQKGGLRKNTLPNGEGDLETRLEYLEFPVNVVFYSKPMKQGFFAGAGANVGVGLYGVRTIENAPYLGWILDEVEDVKFGNGETDDLKTLELGTNLLVGYSFKRGFFFSVTGNFGLNNLSNDSRAKTRNNYIALKAGWLIRRAS